MSIALAMELPTSRLKEWSALADLDFILAHKVLEDPAYAEFFANRPLSREVILDNSYHELGAPLPVEDLVEAAHRSRASYVIAPDRVGDPHFNVVQYQLLQQALDGWKIAVVMTSMNGWNTAERDEFLYAVRNAEMLCCTFKEPDRLQWFKDSMIAKRWHRIHLLGVAELDELRAWAEYAKTSPKWIRWSVDTGKALKWALRGKFMDQIPSVRTNVDATTKGLPSESSQHILDLKTTDISTEAELVFFRNVQILRECCG